MPDRTETDRAIEDLANQVLDLRRRMERFLRGAATTTPTAAVYGARRVAAAKVKALYDSAGGAHAGFEASRWVAFLRCRAWDLVAAAEGSVDFYVACRKAGWFGLPAEADDESYGVAVGEVIVYAPSALKVPVPGVEETYFAGYLEPVLTSWTAAVGEVPTPVE